MISETVCTTAHKQLQFYMMSRVYFVCISLDIFMYVYIPEFKMILQNWFNFLKQEKRKQDFDVEINDN